MDVIFLYLGEQKNIRAIDRNWVVRNNGYLGLHQKSGSG